MHNTIYLFTLVISGFILLSSTVYLPGTSPYYQSSIITLSSNVPSAESGSTSFLRFFLPQFGRPNAFRSRSRLDGRTTLSIMDLKLLLFLNCFNVCSETSSNLESARLPTMIILKSKYLFILEF